MRRVIGRFSQAAGACFLGLLVGCAGRHGPPAGFTGFAGRVPEGLEARLSAGAETDPVAIHAACGRGVKQIPNARTVVAMAGKCKREPHAFKGLAPRAKVDGLHRVSIDLKKHRDLMVPPDMAGTGPFHLVESQGAFYVLTEANFAKVFGPVLKASDVLGYVGVYYGLFRNPFGEIVTKDNASEKRWGGNRRSPALTEVTQAPGGFRVRLVVYQVVHREMFYAEELGVGWDGTVKVIGQPKVLMDFGGGIVF